MAYNNLVGLRSDGDRGRGMPLDWDNVRVFLAVARCGQMLSASQQLGVYHATVARRLATLEKEFKTKLFDRHTTGCTLTAAGRSFLPVAEKVEYAMLRAQATMTTEQVDGVVRIGVSDGFGVFFLSRELKPFVLSHPQIRLQLVPLLLPVSAPKREIEISITVDRPKESHLVSSKLTDYQLRFYAAGQYLDEHGTVTPENASKHVFVSYPGDFLHGSLRAFLRGINLPLSQRFECANVAAQLNAIRSGIGYGILHDYVARQYVDLKPILPDHRLQRTYWLASHAAGRNFPHIAQTIDFVRQCVRSNAEMFLPD